MAMEPNLREDLVQKAAEEFRKRLELKVPLRHFSEFYEEARIKEMLQLEGLKIVTMFSPDDHNGEGGRLFDFHVHPELQSSIEKVCNDYILRNQENRRKSEDFLEKVVDLLCEMLKASMEAHLSKDPDMSLDSFHKLLQMKIAEIVRGFGSCWIWKPGNIEFQVEQKLKLKERLDHVEVEPPKGAQSLLQLEQELEALDDTDIAFLEERWRDKKDQISQKQSKNKENVSPVLPLHHLNPPEAEIPKQCSRGKQILNSSNRARIRPSSSEPELSLPDHHERIEVSSKGLGPVSLNSTANHRNHDINSWNSQPRHRIEASELDRNERMAEGACVTPSQPQKADVSTSTKVMAKAWNRINRSEPVRRKREWNRIVIPSHITILKGHPSMYKCNFCLKVFKTKHYIRSHRSCPEGEKSFKCHVCGKGFNFKVSWEEHVRLHTGEKPYACRKCGQRFSHRFGLRYHTIRKHTRNFPYHCNHCDRGFVIKTHLHQHLRIHSGERPFLCPICARAFNFRQNLLVHIVVAHQEPKDVARDLVKSVVDDYRRGMVRK